MPRLNLALFLSLALFFLAAFALSHITAGEATAQTDECNGAFIRIEDGEPSPFILPTLDDNTLRVEPDGFICISVEDPNPRQCGRYLLVMLRLGLCPYWYLQ